MLDIGGALNQGIAGYRQSMDYAQDRQAKQQALTQEAELFKMKQQEFQTNQAQSKTQSQALEEQLKQAQMQTKALADQMTKQNLYKAFDGGTLTDLNYAIKTDKNIQSLIPGIESVEKVDMTNPEYANQAQGMVNPVLTTSVVDGKIVRKVADLNQLQIRTGYATYKHKRDGEAATAEGQSMIANKELEEMKTAFESGMSYSDYVSSKTAADPKTQAEIEKIRAQTAKALAEASKASRESSAMNYTQASAKLKFEAASTTAETLNQVNNNPEQWFSTLESGDLSTKVGENTTLYSVAKTVQGDEKISTTRRDYMDGMVSTIENTARLKKKMETSDFNWDALSKGMDEITKITGSELREMSASDQRKMLDKFSFDSDMRTVMAGYIKAMSGAAVSDEERKFYEGAILGGNWSTKETAISSMNGFISGLKNGTDSAISGMSANTPATYLEYKSKVKKITTGLDLSNSSIPTVPTQAKEPGVMTKAVTGIKSLWNRTTGGTPSAADY